MEKASVKRTRPACTGLILALHPTQRAVNITSALETAGPWTGTGEDPLPCHQAGSANEAVPHLHGLVMLRPEVGCEGTNAGTALTCLCHLLSKCQPVPLNGEL